MAHKIVGSPEWYGPTEDDVRFWFNLFPGRKQAMYEMIQWFVQNVGMEEWAIGAALALSCRFVGAAVVRQALSFVAGNHLVIGATAQELLRQLSDLEGWVPTSENPGATPVTGIHKGCLSIRLKPRNIRINEQSAEQMFNRKELRLIYAAAKDLKKHMMIEDRKAHDERLRSALCNLNSSPPDDCMVVEMVPEQKAS